MSMLKPAQVATFEARLQARRQQLAEEIRRVQDERNDTPAASLQGTSNADDPAGDQVDQAERRTRQAVRGAEAARDAAELRDIEAALDRIAAGSYGECIDCAADIAVRRLDVQPAAARCLPCQERYEKAHPADQRTVAWP